MSVALVLGVWDRSLLSRAPWSVAHAVCVAKLVILGSILNRRTLCWDLNVHPPSLRSSFATFAARLFR